MDALKVAIVGEPVTVTIRGTVRPLAYPMHNVILYHQRTGDSLFDSTAYVSIDLQKDPERWLACLWAGLHELQSDGSWKAPFTLDELGALVDFSNAGEISVAMVKSLTSYMPKRKDAVPNESAPGEPAQSKILPISESSGPARAVASDSAAANS